MIWKVYTFYIIHDTHKKACKNTHLKWFMWMIHPIDYFFFIYIKCIVDDNVDEGNGKKTFAVKFMTVVPNTWFTVQQKFIA